jgi:hypothetical protein
LTFTFLTISSYFFSCRSLPRKANKQKSITMRSTFAAAALLSAVQYANAQTFTSCNPLTKSMLTLLDLSLFNVY